MHNCFFLPPDLEPWHGKSCHTLCTTNSCENILSQNRGEWNWERGSKRCSLLGGEKNVNPVPKFRCPALIFQLLGEKCSPERACALEVMARGYDWRQGLWYPVPQAQLCPCRREGGIRETGVVTHLEPGWAPSGMGVDGPFASLKGAIINAYKTLWYPMMKGAIQEHYIIIIHTINLWEHAKIFIAKGTFKYLRVPLKGKILQDDSDAYGCLTTSQLLMAI